MIKNFRNKILEKRFQLKLLFDNSSSLINREVIQLMENQISCPSNNEFLFLFPLLGSFRQVVFFLFSFHLPKRKSPCRTQLVFVDRFRFYLLTALWTSAASHLRDDFPFVLNWLLCDRSMCIYFWCRETRNSWHNSRQQKLNCKWFFFRSHKNNLYEKFPPSLPAHPLRSHFYIIIKIHSPAYIEFYLLHNGYLIWVKRFSPWSTRKWKLTWKTSREESGERDLWMERKRKPISHCQPRWKMLTMLTGKFALPRLFHCQL